MNIKNCLKECSQSLNRKRVAIIGLYYHSKMPSRAMMIWSYYRERYETRIITSDFVHPTKQYDKTDWEDCIKLHVPEYKTNISIQRILSHLSYALQINKQLKIFNPDLIHICVPPNYSALRAVRWAKKHKIPSIIDIVDIWPNANVQKNKLLKLAYKTWGSIRDLAVYKADKVLLECSVYEDDIPKAKNTMIPLCKKVEREPKYEPHDDIRIAYLGAFSTSYDFESMVHISKIIKEKGRIVSVVLIGKGDEKEKVIKKLKEAGISTTDYGVVYDEESKANILETCDFGYNGFKPGMSVGQSYKSLDYMGCGLALINSLKGDLEKIVRESHCGFNFDSFRIEEVANAIVQMSFNAIEEMKKNAYRAYEQHFSWEVFEKAMDQIMTGIML